MRPIGARALKSAIDTLRPWLTDATVLDLYAGQGRFGVSALEEGAACVTFVEKNPHLASDLRKATERDRERRQVFARDVMDFLGDGETTFDIIFADPPFAAWSATFAASLFRAVARRLAPGGFFLVKHPSRVVASVPAEGYKPWKSTAFGESQLLYFKYGEEEDHPPVDE